MKIFNFEIKRVEDKEQVIKHLHLDKLEANALMGLTQARVDLSLHKLLLQQSEKVKRTKAEIKGYTDAIERDEKTINNFETQLIAIQHERS
jgi:hypothetical protein